MVYWPDATDSNLPLGVATTALPGFPTKAELRERYAARSGRDVSQLDFYIAFGYWKLACILEGVYTRYAFGAGGGDRGGFEGFAQQVGILAEAAKEAASRL
jgi:aminoglycoside phosphotransferase (APT) family kinase protein